MAAGAVMGAEFIAPEERTMDKYAEFLNSKSFHCQPSGLSKIPPLSPLLMPHQRDVTEWALRLGKAAAFLGTGMDGY